MATPFPFTAGQVLTAAQLNGIGEAWTSYTPVVKGGATTVTATINYAKYAQVNKIVIVVASVNVTSAGAANGVVTMSLPIAAANIGSTVDIGTCGSFIIKDASAAYFTGAAQLITTTEVAGSSYASTQNMGATQPAFTLANGDGVGMFVVYEVA
jgi:hypothetical protein